MLDLLVLLELLVLLFSLSLGTGDATKMEDFFQRAGEGGGAFSIQKFLLQIFDPLQRALDSFLISIHILQKGTLETLGGEAVWNFSENLSVLVPWPVRSGKNFFAKGNLPKQCICSMCPM